MDYERFTMGLRICTNHFQGGYESVRMYSFYHYCCLLLVLLLSTTLT